MNTRKLLRLITPLFCCMFYITADAADVTITSSQSWASNLSYGIITINPGVTLNLTGNYTLNVTNRIDIQPGGALVVNGYTVKVYDRINVKSDYSNPSTTTAGAVLTATNGAIFTNYTSDGWFGTTKKLGVEWSKLFY